MASWEALVRDQGPLVLRAAWRILGNVQDAEDVAQEVLLELFRSRPCPGDVQPGLLRCMAVRRAVDRLRRRRPVVSLEDHPLADRAEGPEAEAMGHELQDRLCAGIRHLPPRQAEVFCLRHLHDLPYEEIAAGLGISRDAVAVALHAARERLRTLLGTSIEETCR